MAPTVKMSEENVSPVNVSITPTQQMISSSTGAIVTSLFVTPLDVVKIRLQAQAKPSAFTKGHCFLYCNGLMDHLCSCVGEISASSEWFKRPGRFKGPVDAAIQIARHEGIASLWSGLSPTLVMAVPATVVYFTCYEQMKDLMGYRMNGSGWTNTSIPLLAGALARVWAVTLISPIEMVRVKLMSEQYSYSQVWWALRETVKVNGVLSLWRGLGPSLLRDVPFSAMYWGGYEIIKSRLLMAKGTTVPSFSDTFIAGAVSGGFAASVTLPFDVIKTRRQIELGEQELMGKRGISSSTWRLIQRIYATEGVANLFSGFLPRLFKVVPSCAIMVSSYEFFKKFFAQQNQKVLNTD